MSNNGQTETVVVTGTRGGPTLKTTATPACYVDIYPYEGDSISLTDAAVLRCTVSKSIKADTGTFELILAPETLPEQQSWTSIITPMSLCVIAMQRADKANVVMIGLVNEPVEVQEWRTGQSVQRVISVRGVDIAYYFTMVDYYSLWYLATQGGNATSITADGLLAGNPGVIGQTWWNQVIASTKGVFKNTYVPYKGGQTKFAQLFGTQFDQYPTFVPYGDYFLGANGPWFNKFRKIFPFPIYEFFVTTAISGNYKASSGASIASLGLGDSISSSAAVIARLNPLPKLQTSVGSGGAASFDSIDVSDWNALPTSDLQGAGFITSTISFSDAEVVNFYNINPTWLNGLNGVSNSNIVMGTLLFSYAVDEASIGRYGYRPLLFDIPWFADPTGQAAKQNSDQVTASFARVLGEVAGYFEPTPLMATATVSTWMRPDLQIGTRFSYQPFRDNEVWDFYIEGVQHIYNFGGPSTTALHLTRGLPHYVYNDSGAGGLLYNVHIGNAQRVNGGYQTGLPSGAGNPLKSLTPTQFADLVATLNSMYTTPQATVTSQGGS